MDFAKRALKKIFEFWKWILGIIIVWMIQRGEFPRIWKEIEPYVTKAKDIAIENVQTTRLQYWSTASCSILLLLLASSVFLRRYRLGYRRYRRDFFGGIVWRWDWAKKGSPNDGNPCRFVAYCPKCDIDMVASGNMRHEKADAFKCPSCNTSIYAGDSPSPESVVSKHVRDRMWKKRLREPFPPKVNY